MADPVSDKSGFLCTYMSSHPDTLVAYVKHFGKVDGKVSSAKMLSIDSKGMNLEFKIKDSAAKPQVVRVAFDPPLLGYEEVKPRLLGMKADADDALGTAKAPQITHFEVPFQIWTTSSLVLFLIYSTIVPEHTTSHFWWLARIVRYQLFPPALFTASWVFMGVVHIAEGVYVTTLARKHHMPWHIATAWVGLVTVFGLPMLLRLRHLIKQARIESIMKGS